MNSKEQELLSRERGLNLKSDKINSMEDSLLEKEALLNEILKKQDLPTFNGDLNKVLRELESSGGSTAACGVTAESLS